MRQARFNDKTIELLGYSSPQRKQATDAFDIFDARLTSGLENAQVRFVYLKARASRESLNQLSKALVGSIKTYFVTPRSSGIGTSDLRDAGIQTDELFTLEDLVWRRVRSAFAEYLEKLSTDLLVEQFFVQPRSEGQPESHPERELLDFLTRSDEGKTPRSLLVLRAPAGVGKTTLCRYVVKAIAAKSDEYRSVPVFVESSHWSRLRLDSVMDLWDVIRNSLLQFSGETPLTEELFYYALSEGLVSFVFDGLDELCSKREVQLSAADLIGELAAVARDSDARIIVTTRTAYWDAKVENSGGNVRRLDLAPFTKQQAFNYFEQRFSRNIKLINRVKVLYSRLNEAAMNPRTMGGGRVQLVSVPFCVTLLADLVEREPEAELSAVEPQRLVERILVEICARDRQRKLATPGLAQLDAFQALCVAQPDETSFDIELLDATGFVASDIDYLVDHPLLNVSGARFSFKYEFLLSFLKARFLARYLTDSDRVLSSDAWGLMRQHASGETPVIEHLLGVLPEDCFDLLFAAVARAPAPDDAGICFLVHVILHAADKDKAARSERSALLLRIIGSADRTIRRRSFVGTFDRLDLRGLAFEQCEFRNARMLDCNVDSATRFTGCWFKGRTELGTPAQLSDWTLVERAGNHADADARLQCDFMLAESQEEIRETALEALHLALQKFWQGGRLKRTIDKNNWNRGLLSRSRYSAQLLSSLLRHDVLREIEISGTESGGYVVNGDCVYDIQKFMDSRQLHGHLDSAFGHFLAQLAD